MKVTDYKRIDVFARNPEVKRAVSVSDTVTSFESIRMILIRNLSLHASAESTPIIWMSQVDS